MAETSAYGLRERKKLRTRATLIEAAADLCLRQGFDNTTVDQIATAADVSPRTFSRYFPTKDAVVAAIADEMDTYIARALEHQPTDITEYDALLLAHLEVFGPELNYQTQAFKRMAVLIQIVNESSSLKASAFAFQRASANASVAVLGRRMGVASNHPAVRVVTDIWTLLFATSFADLGQLGNQPIESRIVCDRLCATFELFRRSWSPWKEPEQEPEKEPEKEPEQEPERASEADPNPPQAR
jgi:AcrR family transcriptional regulator